mmetsp:Transcript_98750/g.313383  ORF Transcript_98750/g.313383 Transcript_98750/m.313383 type:complete len:283 (-) Transcript_98750:853-1701(-)
MWSKRGWRPQSQQCTPRRLFAWSAPGRGPQSWCTLLTHLQGICMACLFSSRTPWRSRECCAQRARRSRQSSSRRGATRWSCSWRPTEQSSWARPTCRSSPPAPRPSTRSSQPRSPPGTRAPRRAAAAGAAQRPSRAASAGWPRAPTWGARCARPRPSAAWSASGSPPAESHEATQHLRAPFAVCTRQTARWADACGTWVCSSMPWPAARAGTSRRQHFQQVRLGRAPPSQGLQREVRFGARASPCWVAPSTLPLRLCAGRPQIRSLADRRQVLHCRRSEQTA